MEVFGLNHHGELPFAVNRGVSFKDLEFKILIFPLYSWI